jgi:hypothetical protein
LLEPSDVPCRSIADILRGMGEVPPSEVRSVDRIAPQPIEIASDPPVSPGTLWIDRARIAAANARDVVERTMDDRSRAERRELYARTLGAVRGYGERSAEQTAKNRERMREYQRRRRAEKAEASRVGA